MKAIIDPSKGFLQQVTTQTFWIFCELQMTALTSKMKETESNDIMEHKPFSNW